MIKNWRNIAGTFFSYQRSDRNAIITLAVLIVILFVAIVVTNRITLNKETDFSELKALVEAWENQEAKNEVESAFGDFDPNTVTKAELEAMPVPGNVRKNLLQYRQAGGTFKTAKDIRKIYGMNDSLFFQIKDHIKIKSIKEQPVILPEGKNAITSMKLSGTIDPNVASYKDLRKYGLNEFQANNLIRYRNSGGRFHSGTDLLKIYGIDSTFYLSLSDYIQIKEAKTDLKFPLEDSLHIELNSIDTAGLMKLPGIGSTLAGRIIKYRKLLGGYYSKKQLLEVYNLNGETYEKIQASLYVDTLGISKIRLNFAEYADLIKHPYLGREEVSKILDYRQRNGSIKRIEALRGIEGFEPELITKISPYITCR